MVKKILVADDNRDITEMLKTVFEAEGYTVYIASNGEEALVKVKENKPDLVILDVIMPNMDGYDVAYYLNMDTSYSPKPKIIMLTVKETKLDKEFGGAMGADVYLTKPFDIAELRKVVNQLLSGN